MPFEPPVPIHRTSPEGLAELRDAAREMDIRTIENQLEAHALIQDCAQKEAAEQRINRYEHRAVEVLEVVATSTAGALSTWKTGGIPLGVVTNWTVGGAAKVGSFINPENRALRVACRSLKVLLHSQIAIHTRNAILDE
jgi:hypothetical protein